MANEAAEIPLRMNTSEGVGYFELGDPWEDIEDSLTISLEQELGTRAAKCGLLMKVTLNLKIVARGSMRGVIIHKITMISSQPYLLL